MESFGRGRRYGIGRLQHVVYIRERRVNMSRNLCSQFARYKNYFIGDWEHEKGKRSLKIRFSPAFARLSANVLFKDGDRLCTVI
ncbi:hypothetical protein R1flu_019592 [Riccia fluitans]|uniref:Uncharacterized protein n=1 Tax=Riccia fluitans TaxID=41844 RepID=A0ABD1ZJ37_9MARC